MGLERAWRKLQQAVHALAHGPRAYRHRLAKALEEIAVLRDFEDLPSDELREKWRAVFAKHKAFTPEDTAQAGVARHLGTLPAWVFHGLGVAERRELGRDIVDTFSQVTIAYGAEQERRGGSDPGENARPI